MKTNRVMAVIDDAEHAQAAVEALERAGVPEREFAALSGAEGEAALARGHLVVDVAVHGRQKRDRVVQILRRHGAHFINAYGQWTIESVAA